MPSDPKWNISIDQFEGLAPGFWINPETSFGNKGHASDLQHVDLTDPNVLTQGPGLSTLTNGDDDGVVDTLIKSISQVSFDGVYGYAVGDNKLYKFNSTTVTDDSDFPHTVTGALGSYIRLEDITEYNGAYYYSYNTDAGLGDIGRLTLPDEFDGDYMSSVPTDGVYLSGDCPHQLIAAGNDYLYCTNGRYIASFDGTTFVNQHLDLPKSTVTVSHTWNHNRLYIAANRPDVTTDSQAESSIYTWDTVSSSWEYQIKVMGKIGALYAKNGIVYVWYKDITSTGGFKLAYVSDNEIKDLAFYTGSLPAFYQVTEYKNHLLWISDGEVWAWGASSNDLPIKLFQYADIGSGVAGGISCIFGTPLVHLSAIA